MQQRLAPNWVTQHYVAGPIQTRNMNRAPADIDAASLTDWA